MNITIVFLLIAIYFVMFVLAAKIAFMLAEKDDLDREEAIDLSLVIGLFWPLAIIFLLIASAYLLAKRIVAGKPPKPSMAEAVYAAFPDKAKEMQQNIYRLEKELGIIVDEQETSEEYQIISWADKDIVKSFWR